MYFVELGTYIIPKENSLFSFKVTVSYPMIPRYLMAPHEY